MVQPYYRCCRGCGVHRLGHSCKCSVLSRSCGCSSYTFRHRSPNRHNTLRISRIRPCITRTRSSKNSRTSVYNFIPNIPDDELLNRAFRDARHAEWVRTFLSCLDEMKHYIGENHPTGLVWNTSVSYAPFHAHHDSESSNRAFMFQSIRPLRPQMPLHHHHHHHRPRRPRHLLTCNRFRHQEQEALLPCSPSSIVARK